MSIKDTPIEDTYAVILPTLWVVLLGGLYFATTFFDMNKHQFTVMVFMWCTFAQGSHGLLYWTIRMAQYKEFDSEGFGMLWISTMMITLFSMFVFAINVGDFPV